jgi:hypothetical protein
MTRSRYGLIAGIAGAAFAAWWWRRRAPATTTGELTGAHERGEVIFRNTPVPYSEGII